MDEIFLCILFADSRNFPELIERTVLDTFDRVGLINNTYRRKMRSLVFTLEHRNTIKEKVIGDDITVKKLVTSPVETQECYERESYRWSNNREKACHVIC